MFEIGNSLREARLRQGLELADVEAATKIRGKYIGALEQERFEVLPAQTYVKGFLRSYAEFLGLDGQLYVDEYNSRYVTGEDDVPFRPRRSTGERRRPRRAELSVVLGALVGIATVSALVIAAGRPGDEPDRRPGPVAVTPRTDPALVVVAERGATRLEVRERSAQGRARFGGTLERGRSQRFELAPRVWVWLQRPANVTLYVNGRREAPMLRRRSIALLVSASGVRVAPAR